MINGSVVEEAILLFGSEDAALRWLTTPAMALNQQRPIDLLMTPDGKQQVRDLLGRLKYGTYG